MNVPLAEKHRSSPSPRDEGAKGDSERVATLSIHITVRHEPPVERACQTNRRTPHPGPLPVEGRGRTPRPVQGFHTRNQFSKTTGSCRVDLFDIAAEMINQRRAHFVHSIPGPVKDRY